MGTAFINTLIFVQMATNFNEKINEQFAFLFQFVEI